MNKSSNIKYQISNIPPLIAVVGETASGKTATAIKIAKKVNGEIICADSRTIYKKMDIGTAKPTLQEQKEVPHHLINLINPDETFSVAEFKRLAQKCIQEIAEKGKIPILVGGTGLYIDAVLYNFQFTEVADKKYRHILEQMNDEELTTLLNTKNINSTNLNLKNRRHVISAIERGGEVPKHDTLRQNTLVLGIQIDREVLKKRITERAEKIFSDGFLDEAKKLADVYGWDHESMSGYKIAREYLEGRATAEEAKISFIRRDNSLAKRQRTWFKRNPHILWFEDPKDLIDVALRYDKLS